MIHEGSAPSAAITSEGLKSRVELSGRGRDAAA
jgi:hypothetical protein